MGMGGMIDVLFLVSGIYLILTAISAKKRGAITANVMLSKDLSERDIKDKIGFIEYMYKRILLAGVMIIIAAVIHFVNDYFIHSVYLTWSGIVVILLAIGIYSVAFTRGRKLYIIQKSGQKKR